MSVKTSYSYQRDLLLKLKDSLDSFKNEMVNVVVNYKDTIQSLHDNEGMMEEIYDEYCIDHLNPTIEALNAIIERIDTADASFIEREINFIQSRKKS